MRASGHVLAGCAAQGDAEPHRLGKHQKTGGMPWREHTSVRTCIKPNIGYEAGPCGFALVRHLLGLF
jgi:hypothetical protein